MNQSERYRIRAALADLNVLLVGGDSRPELVRRLRRDLRLESVVHCPTRKSDASSRCFEYKLNDPSLVLVVCARGLTRTHHGACLHRMCRELSIPLLDCYHLPHPEALLAAIVRSRLSDAVMRRSVLIRCSTPSRRGGVA